MFMLRKCSDGLHVLPFVFPSPLPLSPPRSLPSPLSSTYPSPVANPGKDGYKYPHLEWLIFFPELVRLLFYHLIVWIFFVIHYLGNQLR